MNFNSDGQRATVYHIDDYALLNDTRNGDDQLLSANDDANQVSMMYGNFLNKNKAYSHKSIEKLIFTNQDTKSNSDHKNEQVLLSENILNVDEYDAYENAGLQYNQQKNSIIIRLPQTTNDKSNWKTVLEINLNEYYSLDHCGNTSLAFLVNIMIAFSNKNADKGYSTSRNGRSKKKKRKISSADELVEFVYKTPLDYKSVNVFSTFYLQKPTTLCNGNSKRKWCLKLDYLLYYKPNDFNTYTKDTINFIYPQPDNEVKVESNVNVRQLFEEKIIKHTTDQLGSTGNGNKSHYFLTTEQKNALQPLNLLPFQEKTVSWMLGKEQKNRSSLIGISVLDFLNQHLAYGYQNFVGVGYYNIYTEYLISQKQAADYYNEYVPKTRNEPLSKKRLGVKGLLCEEMGLGKTIELLSLVILNPRRKPGNNASLAQRLGPYIKGKTTLIVTPQNILNQWIDEITLHSPQDKDLKIFHYRGFNFLKKDFPDITPTLIAENLAQYDIVITSYHTISSELHYTEFSKRHHGQDIENSEDNGGKNLRHFLKYDYSSPLSLIQFWRIVLDEVQSVGRSINNNIIKCCSNLQRVHTWGCSGTPIVSNNYNKSVADFLTILAYLQIAPFIIPQVFKKINQILTLGKQGSYSDLQSQMTVDKLIDDTLIKFSIPIRHSKKSVIHEINIPKQQKLLLPLQFQHIEQDKYKNLFQKFLQETGYTETGVPRFSSSSSFSSSASSSSSSGEQRPVWKPDNDLMNKWLKELQMACINFQIPEGKTFSKNLINTTQTKFSMEDILAEMQKDIYQEIDNSLKRQLTTLLYKGRYELETLSQVDVGMETLNKCIEMIQQEQETLLTKPKQESSLSVEQSTTRVKDTNHTLLNLLHQCYFFLATGYYLKGSQRLEKDEALVKDEAEMSDIYKCQELEEHYYNEAELIRRQLLKNKIQQVDSERSKILEMNAKNESRFTALSPVGFSKNDNYSSDPAMDKIFKELSYVFENLDKQAAAINTYIKESEELLSKPILLDSDTAADEVKAKEYETSIENQDLVFSIFDCIEAILENRAKVIDDKTLESIKKYKPATTKQYSKQHLTMLKGLPMVQGHSLKMIFNEIENIRIVKNYKLINDFEYFLLQYSRNLPAMFKEIQRVRDHLKFLNVIYNAKTDYYSSLQKISDALIPLYQLDLTLFNKVQNDYRNFDSVWESANTQISNYKSRLKYLQTLQNLRENEKLTCLICLDYITLGSMIKCGHFFCKNCILEWFKQKTKTNLKCPACSTKTSSLQELYDFKFTSTEDNSNLANAHENNTSSPNVTNLNQNTQSKLSASYTSQNSLFGDYEECKDFHKIMTLNIEVDLGSKINYVFKIIKYIELQHGGSAQILIYTSNLDHMAYLKDLLNSSGVPTLSTMGLLQTEFNHTISEFKKTKNYKVLILNSKRQVAGLTLINASHIIFLDPIINNSDELQAVNRINRIGQSTETYVWTIMMKDSVEESILRYKSSLEESFKLNSGDAHSSNNGRKRKNHHGEVETKIDQDHIWNCFFFRESTQ